MIDRSERCVYYDIYRLPRSVHIFRRQIPESDKMLRVWQQHANIPPCDAIFLPEAPISIARLQSIVTTADIIIYRPPAWDMHLESIRWMYPTQHLITCVLGMLQGCRKRQRDIYEQALVEFACSRPSRALTFTLADLSRLSGISFYQIRKILKTAYGAGRHRWFALYRVYHGCEELRAFPEIMPDVYAVRRDKHGLANTYIAANIRAKNIAKPRKVNIIKDVYKPAVVVDNTEKLTIALEEWHAMKTLIDRSESYV